MSKVVVYLNPSEMQPLKQEAKELNCSVSMLVRTHLRRRVPLVKPKEHLF